MGNTLKQLHGHDQESHAWSKTTNAFYVGQEHPLPPMQPVTSHLKYTLYHVNNLPGLNAEYQNNYVLRRRFFYRYDTPTLSWWGMRCTFCANRHSMMPSLVRAWHICDQCSAIYCHTCGYRLQVYRGARSVRAQATAYVLELNPWARSCRSCEGPTRLID
jgi:hypothetical protein